MRSKKPRGGKPLTGFLAAILTAGAAIAAPFSLWRPPAGDSPSREESAPIRGAAGDFWADVVLGKPAFSEITPYSTAANRLFLPHGVAVDRGNAGDKLYVYDAGNNRILGFHLNTCRASLTNPLDCPAAIVIGQPGMTTSACNGDSGFQNFPVRAPAGASTLCGEIESQLSVTEGGSGASMAVDAAKALYVADFWNNRVLKYNDPFGTDGAADDLWGQSGYTGNACNKGLAAPDATSLCFTWGESNNWTAGVDLDAAGNLWVADSGNNRVLRFPPGSKTADLVLGQPGFTTRASGTALNRMWDPSVVRVSPTTGWVYVAETKNNRVLVFKSPLASGMSGTGFGSGFLGGPQGLDFEPTEPGSVWISNWAHNVVELWSESSGTKIREVGSRDNGNVIGDGTGSVGFDSAGNLYVAIGAGENDNDILVFDKGASPLLPTKKFFGKNANHPSASGLGPGNGVVVSDGQLIVADEHRLLFWNDPGSASTGQPASGYAAGAASFEDFKTRCCGILAADKNHHLFVTGYAEADTPVRVDVYALPLTSGAAPIQSLRFPFNVLGGGQIAPSSFFDSLTGIALSDAGELWLSHSATNRVFRIRDPLTTPVVDVVLGQLSSTGTACNRGGPASANSLCLPGQLALDRLGNLFVSDHSLEIQGNMRMLEFPASSIPSGNGAVLYAPGAGKIFPSAATWQPAFDSHNRMVVGYNPYGPGPNPDGGWFPGVFLDPLTGKTTPDAYLRDYFSMAYSAVFDAGDNLYIADLDRNRVLIYKTPFLASSSLEAKSLSVDTSARPGTSSNTNGILEPGETALVAPSWKNTTSGDLSLSSTGSGFQGPPGAAYGLPVASADYGVLAAGESRSCVDAGGSCFQAAVSVPAQRPATHWDATFVETLDFAVAKTWTLHIGASFTDVPASYVFYPFVERLLHAGVTTGCTSTAYCPDDAVSRLQMAAFVARAQARGDGNVPASGTAKGQPYNCAGGGTSLFQDVDPGNAFCRHVHYIFATGVTTGCEPAKFCPAPAVTRAQMAMFIARAIAGTDAAVPAYSGPNPVTGRSYDCRPESPSLSFTDVGTADIFCRHVHFLWAKDVISGFPDGSYGPALEVTRGAMAKFLSNGFKLPLYGP